jgi:hypothetical protein
MWYCAAYARELCDAMRIAARNRRSEALDAHVARFAPAIRVAADKVCVLIAHSVDLAMKYVAASGLKQPDTPLLEALNALGATAQTPDASADLACADGDHFPPDPEPAESARDNPQVEAPHPSAPHQSSLTMRLARVWRSMF